MANKFEEVKSNFESIASSQGCICESDYYAICRELMDSSELDKINSWLVSSKLILKKGIGEQYKQELLERLKNPNVRDVKDTKDHTNKNRDKKQESKKDIVEPAVQASVSINKTVNELKESDFDEFLPPWKKREARVLIEADEVPEASFNQWRSWLVEYIENHNIPNAAEWSKYVQQIDSSADLTRAWEQIYSGDYNPPIDALPKAPKQIFKEYLDLPEAQDDEPLIEKATTLDPIEVHFAQVARSEYTSKIKKKVKFDNDVVFTVDVADSDVQKAAGLEVFESLAEDRGLLFPFEKPNHVTFHMGRVKFPIDILFFMKDDLGFRTAKIIHSANPGDLDLWSNPNTVCVLEIPGGSCKRLGIGIDSYCQISDRVEV